MFMFPGIDVNPNFTPLPEMINDHRSGQQQEDKAHLQLLTFANDPINHWIKHS